MACGHKTPIQKTLLDFKNRKIKTEAFRVSKFPEGNTKKNNYLSLSLLFRFVSTIPNTIFSFFLSLFFFPFSFRFPRKKREEREIVVSVDFPEKNFIEIQSQEDRRFQ